MDLSTALRETATKFPNKTAVFFNEEEISFSALDASVDRFAAALQGLGVGKGDRVGILMKNCPAFVTALMGILRNGSVAVPVNVFLTPAEIQFICEDSGLNTLVTSTDFFPTISAIMPSTKGLREVIVSGSGGEGQEGFRSFDQLMDSSGSPEAVEIDGDDDAVFLYTSGTTGTPKAAVLSHSNFLSDVDSSKRRIRITEEDSFLLVLPMFHSFSMTVNVFIPVCTGCGIVMLESIRPLENVLKAIMTRRPTIFPAVPQFYSVLVNKPLPPQVIENLPLRLCISGSAPLAESTLKSFEEKFGIPLAEGYGLSEAAPVVSLNPLDRERKVNSIGLPLPGIDVRIVDDQGESLGAKEAGELVVRGGNVMKRYHNRPEDTSLALRDGWLHTGDIAMVDEDGYIYIIDRKKELIISRGMNIYPREIESILYSHPKVHDAAVIGKQDERKDETPVAYLMLEEGVQASPKEFVDYLKGKLAPYKIPREVVFVDEFPRTATGKILKRKLRAM